MYNTNNKASSELWAIVDKEGKVLYSRGGSSSKSRLMVYESESLAKRGLKSQWTQQVIDDRDVEIQCIYIA
jgi:hypothetical protein